MMMKKSITRIILITLLIVILLYLALVFFVMGFPNIHEKLLLNNKYINSDYEGWKCAEIEDFRLLKLPADWNIAVDSNDVKIVDDNGGVIAQGGISKYLSKNQTTDYLTKYKNKEDVLKAVIGEGYSDYRVVGCVGSYNTLRASFHKLETPSGEYRYEISIYEDRYSSDRTVSFDASMYLIFSNEYDIEFEELRDICQAIVYHVCYVAEAPDISHFGNISE